MPDSSTDTTTSTPSTDSVITSVENQLPDAKTESSTVDPAVKADSPPAEPKADKKASFLDTLKKAVDNVGQEVSPTPTEIKKEPEAPEDVALKEVAAVDGTKMTAEDLKGLHPKTKERMQKLLSQNAVTIKERDEEKKVADLYRNLETTMTRDNISADDANQAFEIMRDFTKAPLKALEAIERLRDSLLLITGKKLPDDLAAQVNEGLTNEATAKETARLRLEAAQRSVDDTRKANAEAERQKVANETMFNEVRDAVVGWETQWKKTDLDYLKKQSGVLKEFNFRMGELVKTGKVPTTKKEAVELAESCRKAYEAEIGKFATPKKEITHVSGGSVGNVAPEKAKSLAGAILQKVNK